MLVHEYIDGWIASPTQWTWVWINSGSWWWTGRPCVLQSTGSQRVRHNWATELNWTCWCCTSWRRMLHFMVEQVFLPKGRFVQCIIHNAVGRERRPNGREKFLCLKFFLSCHKIRILFHLSYIQTVLHGIIWLNDVHLCALSDYKSTLLNSMWDYMYKDG